MFSHCMSPLFQVVQEFYSGHLKKFSSPCFVLCFVVTHFADGVVRSSLFASVLVMRLTRLPESIIAFACTFLIVF